MKKFHYYRQHTKTGCFLYALCTALQMSRKKIEERHGDVISFSKHNYLHYYSAGRILQRENKDFGFLYGDKEFSRKNNCALLGVNLRRGDYYGPIHTLFYDGKRAWEPFDGKFHDINDLKVVSALLIFDKGFLGQEAVDVFLGYFKKIDEMNESEGDSAFEVKEKMVFKYLKIID